MIASNTSYPGGNSVTATSSPTGAIEAIAPSNSAAPTVSGEAKDGSTLVASSGKWTGTPTLSYSYQWERCEENGEGCASICEKSHRQIVRLTDQDLGKTIRLEENASNASLVGGANVLLLSVPSRVP